MDNKNNITYSHLGKVRNIYLTKEMITVVYDAKIMEILAYADCCSYSWFEYPSDLKKIIGSKIINITEGKKHIDMPASNIQEYDENRICYIYTENRKTPYIFYLRNSSNGYYSGWLEIEIKSKDEKYVDVVQSRMSNAKCTRSEQLFCKPNPNK